MTNLSPYAFIELFVVLAFLAAWGILEILGKRLDASRDREARERPDDDAAARSAQDNAEIPMKAANDAPSIDWETQKGKSE